jgi:hypothetical protein
MTSDVHDLLISYRIDWLSIVRAMMDLYCSTCEFARSRSTNSTEDKRIPLVSTQHSSKGIPVSFLSIPGRRRRQHPLQDLFPSIIFYVLFIIAANFTFRKRKVGSERVCLDGSS